MADIYSRLMDGLELAQQGAQRKRQSRLAQLASQAYGADPEAQRGYVQQAIGLDPQAGFQIGQSLGNDRDSLQARLAQEAEIFSEAPDDQKAAMYPQLAAHAKRLGFPVPDAYDPRMLPMIQKIAMAGVGTSQTVQSTYIDAQGNRVAILRNGQTQVLGQNAPNNQIIDTGNGFYGVNKGNLQAAPVMIGGPQAQQPPSGYVNTPSGPVNIDPSLPPEIRAQIAANPDQFTQGGVTQGAPVVQDGSTPQQPASQPEGQLPPPLDYQNGGQLRSVPKPISPADQQRLDMERQRIAISQQAADRATQAAQSAAEAKDSLAQQKANKASAAAQDTIDNLNDGVSQIDNLLKAPGMKYLGSVEGDAMLHIPLIRNAAKDANAQLDVIRNRVVLSTLASLKSLSTNGASGFGALSNQEGEILRNSIASLSNAQTNAQIVEGLKQVQNAMRRSAQRIRALQGGQAPATPSGPDDARRKALLDKY